MHASHAQPQHEAVLTNSQQLRNEFTFLLRALDHCGNAHREQQHTHHHHVASSQRRHLGGTQAPQQPSTGACATGSSAVFTYALEVALALVRFDVLLSSEERRLLVHAFDRLLDEELRSLHRTQQELVQLEELAHFLKESLDRASALDVVDWHHVTARYVVEREQWLRKTKPMQASSDDTQHSNAATPKASSGGLLPVDTELSRAIAQTIVSPSALYTNLLLFGTCHKTSAEPNAEQEDADGSNVPQLQSPPGLRNSALVRTDAFTIMQTTNMRNNNSMHLRASSGVLSDTTATAAATADSATAPTNKEPVVPAAFVLYRRPLVIPERTAQWSTHLLIPPPPKSLRRAEPKLVVSMRPSSMDVDDFSANTFCSTVTLVRQLSVFGTGVAASTPKSKDAGPFFINDEEIASLASTVNEGVNPLSADDGRVPLVSPSGPSSTTPVPSAEHGEVIRRSVSSVSKSSALSRTGSSHNIDMLPTGGALQRKPTTLKGSTSNAPGHALPSGGPTTTPNRAGEPVATTKPPPQEGSTFPAVSADASYQLLHRIVAVALLSEGDDTPPVPRGGSCSTDVDSMKAMGVSRVPSCPLSTTSPMDSTFGTSLLVPDAAASLRPVSGAIVKMLERILESVSHVRRSLQAMKRQIRSEITLLCFRVVSTVIDLLLPAAECRGKPLTIFYRKWLCDVYRVLCEENLLRPFASLVNRARQTPEANVVSMPTPPKAVAAVRRTLSPSLAPLDLGDSVRAATSPLTMMTPLAADNSNSSACMNGLLNASLDALDDSTTVGATDGLPTEPQQTGTTLLPNLLNRQMHHQNDGGCDDEDAHTAVGALFRTYRLDNTTGDQQAMSPSSVGSCGSSSNGGGVGKQHASEAVNAARTLFRSLHGAASIPPAGHLGTRLMFTLLNGTDVNAMDLKETDQLNQSAPAETIPTHLDAYGTGVHHARSNSTQDPPVVATRSRTNSSVATPLSSPSIQRAGVSTGRSPALGHASTTTMLAMPHHHTFRYPVVRDAGDVRGLYSALFSDAESVLMPHDPLRAAVTLNYAEFLVRVVGSKAEAAGTIRSYLDEVEMEPIQQIVSKVVDFGHVPSAVPSVSTHATVPPPPSSAFSVTNVRRTGATSGGASIINNQPPTTPLATHTQSAAAAPSTGTSNSVSVMEFVPSWNAKEERAQFLEIVGLLRAAEASLR